VIFENRRDRGGSRLSTMDFVDSHAHLADPAFDADRELVIARALASGARAIICIGESLGAAARARTVAESRPGSVFFTAGVHPHDAGSFEVGRDVPLLEEVLRAGAVAVGECGFDYHYDNAVPAAQRAAMGAQLDVARRLDLPLVVHTRDAEADTRALLADAARLGVKGVLHCFTGSHALARSALDAGWYVSFSGIITFKNWTDEPLLRLVPDDRLLAESDSPYLAPVPHRGQRNEPGWVGLTVACLARARGVADDNIGEAVDANARTLFRLDRRPSSASAASASTRSDRETHS
jgi:TatD DNase family protein